VIELSNRYTPKARVVPQYEDTSKSLLSPPAGLARASPTRAAPPLQRFPLAVLVLGLDPIEREAELEDAALRRDPRPRQQQVGGHGGLRRVSRVQRVELSIFTT
jgi:hypothetical protein